MGVASKKPLPLWAEQYRRKGVQIVERNGVYQLKEITSTYDNILKKSVKISKYLGTITIMGFIPRKDTREKLEVKPFVRNYGDFLLLDSLCKDIKDKLDIHFKDDADILFTIALLRLRGNLPFKDIFSTYEDHYLSNLYPNLPLSGSAITQLLERIGKNRSEIVDFMNEFISNSENIAFDGTTLLSDSKSNELCGFGYNHHQGISYQTGLMYGYNVLTNFPIYYKIYDGSIKDGKVMKDVFDDILNKDYTFTADKGFSTPYIFDYLESNGGKYIIPLKRNSTIVNKEVITDVKRLEYFDLFVYNFRTIYCYKKEIFTKKFIEVEDENGISSKKEVDCLTYIVYSYLDTKLATDELMDNTLKLKNNKNTYSKEQFNEEKQSFGIFHIKTNILTDTPLQTYTKYKIRNGAEVNFNILKNTLSYDRSYMQNMTHLEGWSFINHITLMMASKVYGLLLEKNISKEYTLESFLLQLNKIKLVKTSYLKEEVWKTCQVPKKTEDLCKLIGISMVLK